MDEPRGTLSDESTNELIGVETVQVEKFNLDRIPFLYFRNTAVFDWVKKQIPHNGVKILSIETPRQTFLNVIIMRKGRHVKVFYYKYTRSRPNLIPVFCRFFGIHLGPNEWVWMRDSFFKGNVIITQDEIIGVDKLDVFYTRPGLS